MLGMMVLMASIAQASGQGTGTFAVITDIHFNPFARSELAPALAQSPPADWPAIFAQAKQEPMSPIGEDTNHALLVSSLAAFSKSMVTADFAMVSGDLLVHDFNDKAASALGVDAKSPAVHEMAIKTALFVADALAEALSGKPVIVALGNVDSGCGDYQIDPGGQYLAATREAVRRLVGHERLAPDFDQTYAAGGYYAARHPTVSGGLIIVLNDVLWSTRYHDTCGHGGLAAAQAMLSWFSDQLARQRAEGGSVWLVHHIPWGIDTYSTLTKPAATCRAKVVSFLREPFASEFPALLAAYQDVLRTSIAGHTHFDDYRLLTDSRGAALVVEKIVPAISPLFGQNPAFQVFTYDRRSGEPGDFSTWYLANPGAAAVTADWRFEYTFTTAFGFPDYTPGTIAALWKGLSADATLQTTYRRLYSVGRGELPAPTLRAYACALGHLSVSSFTTCYCGALP